MGSTKNVQKARLMLSRQQLISLRRFMNRGLDCAEGNCHPRLCMGEYFVKPLRAKINDALDRLNKAKGKQ